MQQWEALEGEAGEPASEGPPPQSVHTAVAPKECGARGECRRGRGLPPDLSHHMQPGAGSLNSKVELAVWRRQQRQLVALGGPAAEAMQPEVEEEAGLDGEVKRAAHHKAWV